jgi:MFS transporter, DHA1 family, tetracycline resistance protein
LITTGARGGEPLLPAGLVTSPVVFLVVSLVAGLGGGLINPPANAVVADVIGGRARGGTVLAGFQMAADLGAIVGPVLAGVFAEAGGFAAAFAVTGMVSLVALGFWVRAPETLPVAPSSTAQESLPGCAATECPPSGRSPRP